MQVHLLGVYLQDRLEEALILITNRKKIQPIRGKSFHPSQRQNQNTLLLIFSNGETWFDFLIKKAKVHLK